MPFTGYADVFEPADLEVLHRVFDGLCEERRLGKMKDREQREELAAEIIRAFQHGDKTEDGIWRRLSKRRRAHTSEGGAR